MWERGWWQRLSIGPYSFGAMPHRTDNKRRGNSLPRQGLQLCVAPYFADGCRRHAGTVEVHRENATPEAVAGCHRTTQRPDKQCNICYTTADATAPHPSRVRFGGCPSAVPACRHDPAWRNTGLRTAATPRGVAEMSASGHRLRRGRRGGRCAAPDLAALAAAAMRSIARFLQPMLLMRLMGPMGDMALRGYKWRHFTRCEVPPSRSL